MIRFVLLCLACAVWGQTTDPTAGDTLDGEIADLKSSLATMGRQIMMQQLASEERARSSGDSGIKIVRLNTVATNPYLTHTYSLTSNSAIHDHANNIRTVGMGEVVVVLNGVEFRTRHNDYRLYKPHSNSSAYHDKEDIDFPDVPPAVTTAGTVQQQIDEMRLWFKAFKEQDYSVRDYRPYFKPVLCYLEGAWTFADSDNIDEPFDSDRHHIDASSWFDLQDKIRYTSGTGAKSNLENFAFLPTTIASIENDVAPKFAQWNYRIMCHPLSTDVPTNRFKMVDDFASRMLKQYPMPRQAKTRAARFYMHEPENDDDEWPQVETTYITGLLDDLMHEIPGKDNYQADIEDNAFGISTTKVDTSPLNAGYYHRVFRTSMRGAMGLRVKFRGFNDQNMFVAYNTQDKVMPVTYKSGNTVHEQRASYAIPLEIIYMTPLSKWNPYNIVYRGNRGDASADAVTANGRDGTPTLAKAYDGIHSRLYYQTPMEFFGSGEVNSDAADTAWKFRSVLDSGGQLRNVSSSGTRIFLPVIGDLGSIRTRYPINPVYDEGSVTRKELEAIKEAFLELRDYKHMLRTPLDEDRPASSTDTVLELGTSTDNNVEPHTHTVTLTPYEVMEVLFGRNEIYKDTSMNAGHMHKVSLKYSSSSTPFKLYDCDEKRYSCWDGHPRAFTVISHD